MKKWADCFALFLIVVSLPLPQSQSFSAENHPPRERLLMDSGWRFAYGHPYDAKKDFNHATGYFSYFAKAGYGDGPAAGNFDDRAWRVIDLPHDWAVELPFSDSSGYSHGYKTLGRNFPETSIGWYRKTFHIPEADLGRRIGIEFDGVFRNATVWVNGFYLGQEHSGYSGFRYDITDYLHYGGDNAVAVRVDATMEEGWFYEGAGIYRHVWLTKTAQLHVAPCGIFILSELKDDTADVTIRSTLANEGAADIVFDVEHTVVNADGQPIATGAMKRLALKPSCEEEFSSRIQLVHPALWSIETPSLYRLVTLIRSEGSVVDRVETPFGVRSVRFDPGEGFFLNGRHVQLKGTNNHQDHAGVGTAVPDALQEFRIARLKEMGCNAYRCSHNPPTPELLDACDRLGMLVIDENRLMGSNTEHLDLLKRMILRDRNHPSVFIWSIGNEEWAIEGNATGARIAATMQAYAMHLDPSRRVTYANSGGWGHGISTVNDVMGFNYIFNGDIDRQHADFPNQPGMGTEETTSRGTRGAYEDDAANAHMEATDRKSSDRSIETGFNFYAARPFLSGLFFWTGFDYRGEPNPFGWPQVVSQCGILDLCGFPKDMFYYLKSRWTDKPVLHLLPHWNWNGGEGRTVRVWAYGNCDEVDLSFNKKSLGRKTLPEDGHLEWTAPYEPGFLLAKGYRNGKMVVTDRVETSGDPASVRLAPDRLFIRADGEDVSVITVRVDDGEGRCVPYAGNEIMFFLKGPGRIIGVGNGDPSSHEPDRYFERVNQAVIADLKAGYIPAGEDGPETCADFDDSGWPSALDSQGNYGVRPADSLKTMVIRGTFRLPDFSKDAEINLYPKSLGEEQTVYVNGHLVAKKIKRNDPVLKYTLDPSVLRKGKNVYAVVGTPLVPRYLYDYLNTDPGVVQVIELSGHWKRRVFNGLAQVIVQSSKEPGEIVLTAESEGLSKGTVRIRTQPAIPRPAVPTDPGL
jgi:beta-galactosidase